MLESRIGTFYDGLKALGYDHLPTLLEEDNLSTLRKDLGDLGVAPRHIDRVVIRIENHRSLHRSTFRLKTDSPFDEHNSWCFFDQVLH